MVLQGDRRYITAAVLWPLQAMVSRYCVGIEMLGMGGGSAFWMVAASRCGVEPS